MKAIRYKTVLLASVSALLVSGCPQIESTEIRHLSVSVSRDAAIAEGDSGTTVLQLTVTRSAFTKNDVSVDYSTSDWSANTPSDYMDVGGTLVIPGGSMSSTVEVEIVGDSLYERDEKFLFEISSPVGAILGNSLATVTITNDDTAPSLQIEDSSVVEGDSGTSPLQFPVRLSEISGVDTSADYSTRDDTALDSEDYASITGVVTIPAGSISATIDVQVSGDTDQEADETFRVMLSNPTNGVIVDGDATGTINNDDTSAVEFGLDSRPQNTLCLAPARQVPGTGVDTIDAFPNLPNANQPTKILLEPVPDPRWFLLQKTGELRVFNAATADSFSTFLDLSGVVDDQSEGGLLGMAFHPNYPNTPEVFLSYTIPYSSPSMRSVISKFVLDDVTTPGAGTIEQVVIEIDQDFTNHNGGDIAFGADGFLYIGLGDGGSGGDPNNRAQDTRHLLGSFLRIDVLDASVSYPLNPYVIPADNPFSGNPKCGPGLNGTDCPEIYAWGLRNPWRWSFDPATGDLWAADVGQSSWEEIDLIDLGGNYGWRCREGAHDFNTSGCGSDFEEPVSEYAHDNQGGDSITGGFVYRGSAIAELSGRYVFGDYGSGRIWALLPDGLGGYVNDELLDTSYGITAFGVDTDGELYFTDTFSGRVRKLIAEQGSTTDNIPTLLSDSGCVDAADVTQPYSGLIPYGINAPFWSDGVDKRRYLAIPGGTTIGIMGNDDWNFPNGSVIVKEFRINGRLVETRHLMRHPDGVWGGYTYEWNSNETEATRVRGGKTANIDGQDWIYPSESQCLECHTAAADVALGPETAQLNGDFLYPSTQRVANQLETYDHIFLFSAPLPGPVSSLPALTDPEDTAANLDDRARAYLHTNCSQCHRPGGPTPTDLDLRYDTALQDSNGCDVAPLEGDLGITDARIIAPGDVARSVLANRIDRRDANSMPPLGSNIIDSDGHSLISAWISDLAGCN